MSSIRCLGASVLVWVAAGCAAGPVQDGVPVDLLVFAPHPDDETLGCAGILRQAIASGKRVRVVIFTHGDGFPGFASRLARKPEEHLVPDNFLALARYRRNQSLEAMRALGGRVEDVVFLGYPDSGLMQVYETRGPTPFRQKFTGKSGTYDVARPAPYTRASALADVEDMIRDARPGRILVTHPADRHPDHQAAYRFVHDAVDRVGYRGPFETYLVHGGPEWPWPAGITPQSPLEAHEVKGERIPSGVPWPPSRRVPLSAEDARHKLAAIQAHSTHLADATDGPMAHEKAYLESFVKSEEVFWAR